MQLPSLPHPPRSTWRRTDTPDLIPKRRGSNTPSNPHPESMIGNQLPPIRNLVPNLWEPGTSKSSQQTASEEGGKASPVYPFRTASVWSSGSTSADDRLISHPQPEANRHEGGGNREASRQVNESNKRRPPSPIERDDHTRTAPSNGVIDSNRWTISHAHKPSQTSTPTREIADVRPLSSSEATKVEFAWSDPQPPHQQQLLRDPVGELWVPAHGQVADLLPHSIAFSLTATPDTSTTHDHQ